MDLAKLLECQSDYSPMQAGGFDLGKAYGYGETVARDANLTLRTDLHDLVVQNGGTIHYIDFATFSRYPDVFENSIYVHKERDFDIILPLYASHAENRYTIAHELGHYVLHSKGEKCYACRQGGSSPLEREAECFALGFILPSELFKEMIKKYPNRDLSVIFQVPENIVEIRKQSLGIS